jgi:hypothetical protein
MSFHTSSFLPCRLESRRQAELEDPARVRSSRRAMRDGRAITAASAWARRNLRALRASAAGVGFQGDRRETPAAVWGIFAARMD